jgi:hypothetical protein
MNPPTSKYTHEDFHWALEQLAIAFICLLGCFIGAFDMISWAVYASTAPIGTTISSIPMLQGSASILIGLFALNFYMFRHKQRYKKINGGNK